MGWRFWEIRDGRLVSPFQFSTLPPTGLIEAHCDDHPRPPVASHLCGIAYYPTIEAMTEAARLFNLSDTDAITIGEVIGTTVADPSRTYATGTAFSWRMTKTPQAWRCSAYRVLSIITPSSVELDYPVPIIRGHFDQIGQLAQ
jgi:hypothetical protein